MNFDKHRFVKSLANYRTSTAGVLGGGLVYFTQAGFTMPETNEDWFALALAVVISVLGFFAKDGATGSKPTDAA